MKKPALQQVIDNLHLKPLWSDDYLIEFYCSKTILAKEVLGDDFDGDRPIFNWAYYLLPEKVICPFHLHVADESWQYCLGGPLELFLIYPEDGRLEKVIIGPDMLNNQKFIHIVPKNVWFAAKTVKNAEYTLITHLVSPAFFPQDKIKGYRQNMLKEFPQHSNLIKELSWPVTWDKNL